MRRLEKLEIFLLILFFGVMMLMFYVVGGSIQIYAPPKDPFMRCIGDESYQCYLDLDACVGYREICEETWKRCINKIQC